MENGGSLVRFCTRRSLDGKVLALRRGGGLGLSVYGVLAIGGVWVKSRVRIFPFFPSFFPFFPPLGALVMGRLGLPGLLWLVPGLPDLPNLTVT